MARVDHLPEGARELLRTGAVIEREFSHELIQKVTGLLEQDLLSRNCILRIVIHTDSCNGILFIGFAS
jgi:hypothetical protein